MEELNKKYLKGFYFFSDFYYELHLWEALAFKLRSCVCPESGDDPRVGVTKDCESWTIKKAEHQRIDAFELWC